MTEGALSVESEYISLTAADEKSTIDFRVMRTDAAINSGNSGGALFDAQGKLIGITNAKRVDQLESDRTTIDSVDNIGYALPITQVKYAVENILDNNGGIKRAMFGISVQLTDSKAVLGKRQSGDRRGKLGGGRVLGHHRLRRFQKGRRHQIDHRSAEKPNKSPAAIR